MFSGKAFKECDEDCEHCCERFSCEKRILMGYERLAFGSSDDAVKLILENAQSDVYLSGKDLFNVSEIKKPRDGAIEIKFYDRITALEHLEAYRQNADSTESFYAALEKSAGSCRGGDKL